MPCSCAEQRSHTRTQPWLDDFNLQRRFVSYGIPIISAKKKIPFFCHGKVACSAPSENVNVSIIECENVNVSILTCVEQASSNTILALHGQTLSDLFDLEEVI